METKFDPFQRVLVREYKNDPWMCDIYSHEGKDTDAVCIGGVYSHCIPYEGNENLLGTTDYPKPKRWRADIKESYYFMAENIEVFCDRDDYAFDDDARYTAGNYFRTREEAAAMAEKIKKLLKG